MICTNQYFNFENEVHMGEDLYTTYQGKELVLKEVYRYFGPVTMQYLPYGGIQSVFNYQLIITTKSGFITTDFVIYDGQEMPVKDFIEKFPDLVNEVLPS